MTWGRGAIGLALWSVGCLTPEEAEPLACSGCHGSAETPAPPTALGGFTDPSYRGVGAHQPHLFPAFSNPVACGECHLVPDSIDAPGHRDTLWPAEVSWAQAELQPDASEPFDSDALSCTVYCHGATLSGGSITNPIWTVPFEGAVCDDCHGYPPPTQGHSNFDPDSDQCSDCHPQGPEVHIDGELQVSR